MLNMTYSKLTNCAQQRSKLRRTWVIVSVEMQQNFHWTAYLNSRTVCVCLRARVCVDFYETPNISYNPKKTQVNLSCRWWPRRSFPKQQWIRVYKPPRKRQAVTEVDDVYRVHNHTQHSLPVDKRLISTDNTPVWCKDRYTLWLLQQRGFLILITRQFCPKVWHRLIETGPSINTEPYMVAFHNAHHTVTVGAVGQER